MPKNSRKEKLLSPLKGKVRRRPFLVLDIESKDGDSQEAGFTRPFMAGIYDGTEYYPFFDTNPGVPWEERYWEVGGCIDRAMRFVFQKKFRGHQIYAHNAGRFDYLFLLPWLMNIAARHKFMFDIVPIASAIQVLDVWHGKKRNNRWRFLDSFKLIPTTLDKAAKGFGLPGKVEHDLNLHESDPRWVEYNAQDCIQLYRVLERFHHYIEDVLMGEVGITAPATALKLFRRRYLEVSIPRAVDTHAFIREGYVGGRVEPFEAKGEHLRYYDINSSYPAAMLEEMPAGTAVHWAGNDIPTRLLEHRLGFARVKVEVPDTAHIPVLPVKSNGKLIFPTGKLEGVWAWNELQLAVREGAVIHDIVESVWYEKMFLFRDFVKDLYKYRDKSRPDYDEGLAEVVKILLNATYGKFGMRTLRKRIFRYDDPELPERATPASPSPDSLIWYAEEEVDAPYILPQISAWVTALARIRLFNFMRQALDKGGRVYYCDTDSILTDVELDTSSALGALKDEYPEVSGKISGEFMGPKMYALLGPDFCKVRAKGLEKKKAKIKKDMTEAEKKRLLYEAELEAYQTLKKLEGGEEIYMYRLEKIGSLARAGFMRGPKMTKVPRKFERSNDKRVFYQDGTSRPVKLVMW